MYPYRTGIRWPTYTFYVSALALYMTCSGSNHSNVIIIIIVFIEINMTIATCYNDTPNKLSRKTALHCI